MKYITAIFFFKLAFFFGAFNAFSQKTDFDAEITVTSIASSQSEIPFWFRANTGNEFSEFTNLSGVLNSSYTYNFEKYSLEAGAYVFFRDGFENNLERRDLYLQLKHKYLKVTLGSKQRDEAFSGLSSTNQNYLYSNNARPLPGLIIEANEPFKIFKIFDVDWGIAHYSLNDDIFVEDVRIHYKRLNVSTALSTKSKLTLGLQHFVQWAGTSPTFGRLKGGLEGFWNVLIANQADEIGVDGEIQNAVGNHLGSYLFRYDLNIDSGEISFYHEHPFEDGSGTAFKNFPDGVWGATYKLKKNRFINAILYEYVDTRDQSFKEGVRPFDSYFTNLVYTSGWTYETSIIGSPFFKTDNSLVPSEFVRTITGSRFQVHHIGVAGSFKNIDWKLKMSYSKNLGRFGNEFAPPQKDFYSTVEVVYPFKSVHKVTLFSGLDLANVTNTIVAGGFSYTYKFLD